MTTQPRSEMSTSASVVGGTEFNEWIDAAPKAVTFADSMSEAQATKALAEMYRLAGIATGSEKQKKAFRMWIYVQGALNGTSRSGDYSTNDKLADGTEVAAAIIPRVLGREIRKFFRANMDESYKALKTSKVMESYPRFISRCANMGIGASEAFATADWMDDCPHFTPNETAAHHKSFLYGIARARRARDGRTLEQVEDESVAASVRVNGPDASDVGRATAVEF